MSNIEYRVWDNGENKYFEPVYEAYKGNLLDLSIGLGGRLLRRTMKFAAEDESWLEGRYEIELCSGLPDKNEVKIHKGDIINVYKDGELAEESREVKFEFGSFYFNIDYDQLEACLADYYWGSDSGSFELEVVGNIHKNKDLLTK